MASKTKFVKSEEDKFFDSRLKGKVNYLIYKTNSDKGHWSLLRRCCSCNKFFNIRKAMVAPLYATSDTWECPHCHVKLVKNGNNN